VTETILYLIAAVLILGVLRSVIGVVLKGVSDFFGAPSSTAGAPIRSQASRIPTAEELKKDPVCGTYLPPSAAIQKSVGGTIYYFCSVECRDKFSGKASPSQ
jgi:YHS domain-containing protein